MWPGEGQTFITVTHWEQGAGPPPPGPVAELLFVHFAALAISSYSLSTPLSSRSATQLVDETVKIASNALKLDIRHYAGYSNIAFFSSLRMTRF